MSYYCIPFVPIFNTFHSQSPKETSYFFTYLPKRLCSFWSTASPSAMKTSLESLSQSSSSCSLCCFFLALSAATGPTAASVAPFFSVPVPLSFEPRSKDSSVAARMGPVPMGSSKGKGVILEISDISCQITDFTLPLFLGNISLPKLLFQYLASVLSFLDSILPCSSISGKCQYSDRLLL